MTQINHTEYPKSLRSKSDDALRYIMKDAAEAERNNPEGDKAGYYLDEINYAAMELKRRADIGRPTVRQSKVHSAVCSKGYKIAEVANFYGVSPSTIRRWMDIVTDFDCKVAA